MASSYRYKLKRPVCLLNDHAINTHVGVELLLHIFFTFSIYVVEWSAS